MAQGRREQIVAASLELAAEAGWDDLRLHQVAERLGLPLAGVHAEFRDRDAIANAWFDRALDADAGGAGRGARRAAAAGASAAGDDALVRGARAASAGDRARCCA